MRQSVRKPLASPRSKLKKTSGSSKSPTVFKPLIGGLDEQRLQKAQNIHRSKLIKHFNPSATVISYAAPAIQVPMIEPAKNIDSIIKPSLKASKSERLFSTAMEKSTSHQQLREISHRKPFRSAMRRGSVALAVLLVIGFIGWLKLPSVRLHMASKVAGFSASAPSYHPSGYSMSALKYSSGQVSMNYKSTSDTRNYSIVQKASNWDSETLRQLFVAKTAGADYQTVEVAGRTIYLFDGSATWMNGGIWYHITAKDSLNQHQLVELASSL